MDFYSLIKILYPQIEDHHFTLCDQGKGIYLSSWTYDAPKPDLSLLLDKAGLASQLKNMEQEIRSYLESMKNLDWYYVRKIRTGKEVPDEINRMMASFEEEVTTLRLKIASLVSQLNDTGVVKSVRPVKKKAQKNDG